MDEFQSTLWTVIRGARSGDEAALREFALKYRAPVVAYAARRGLRDEAEDIAQEVFLRLFQDGVLAKADPSKGRFRSLVLAVTRNVIGHHVERAKTKKRGGGRVQSLGDLDPAGSRDDDFDREWVSHLVEVALARLAKEHPSYHAALSASLEGRPYEGDSKNHLFRGRQKLAEYLRDQVRDYSTSRADYEEELRYLSGFLPK